MLTTDLLQQHERFDETLGALRRTLCERDPDTLVPRLAWLDQALRTHIRQEEDLLLPLFAPLAEGLPPNVRPGPLRNDHRILERHLARFVEHAPDVASHVGLMECTTASTALAHTLEHHDDRERHWFKPVLDAAAPEGLAEALQQIAQELAAAPGAPDMSEGLLPAPKPWPAHHDLLGGFRYAVAQSDRDGARRLWAPLRDELVKLPHRRLPRHLDGLDAHLDAWDQGDRHQGTVVLDAMRLITAASQARLDGAAE
jgi:hypothetical protein